MNLLDVLIIAFLVSATIGGYRLGLLMRATSWIGLIIGVLVAAHFAPDIIKRLQDQPQTNRWLVAAGIFMGAAFAGQALGLLLGSSFYRAIRPGPLRELDRIGGAIAAFAGVVAVLWLLLPSMTQVQGWPARQSRNSAIARTLIDLLPPPPDTLKALERLVGSDFPKVFTGNDPAPIAGAPPASAGLTDATAARVAASTVKVEGTACRRIQDGSGFSPAPDTIVTNAHVVAGERQTYVIRPNETKRLPATVVVFDPNRDLAVLHVPGLGQAPLPVGAARVGTTGAVFGHPNGQAALAISPALIQRQVEALGRDLYDQRETRRKIFILAADLHPGDSGGALVDRNGGVVGVAFAIAPDRAGTAYALTSDELRAVLVINRSSLANTGPCIAG